MAYRATWRVSDDHEPAVKQAEADEPLLSVVSPGVLDFCGQSVEDKRGVLEVQASVGERPVALGRVEGDPHRISVYTKTRERKRAARDASLRDLMLELSG